MKGSTGRQTRIGTVVPNLSRVRTTKTLSKQARLRLAWMDYYAQHGNNAALTCRHYGIAKSCFYKWQKRFKATGPGGLEEVSRRPQHVRQPLTAAPVVSTIRTLRKHNPELSKYKLAVILRRDYGYSVSASTIGRIISRYDLFFAPPVKPKRHPQRRQSVARIRKPYGYKPTRPGELIEFDVKHLPNTGERRYGFVAIDVFTKQAIVHVSRSPSAYQAAIAWKKVVHRLGLPEAALTDNGSENFGVFAELLKEQQVTHYFARPRAPKDKPHVERFIGSLEKECIQWGGVATDLADQQEIINQWLKKYHSYRPHQALGYLTPDEYQATIRQ